jgi:hypothetical protein
VHCVMGQQDDCTLPSTCKLDSDSFIDVFREVKNSLSLWLVHSRLRALQTPMPTFGHSPCCSSATSLCTAALNFHSELAFRLRGILVKHKPDLPFVRRCDLTRRHFKRTSSLVSKELQQSECNTCNTSQDISSSA